MRDSIGLYIHIPFCRSKCHYCDFNSYSGREDYIPAYFHALMMEIEHYSKKVQDRAVKTIFIGGGTPSVVDCHYISNIMDQCRNSFYIEENAETSIETNPGTLSFEKLAAYREAGINRLSMGLQAWQGHLLKDMGRIHSVEQFIENFMQARKAGFSNINADLIFGLPGQTLADWNESLEGVIKLGAEHFSCYSLKIEEGTAFGDKYELGKLKPIADELDREMYYTAVEALKDSGYRHYEISNFARPGHECRHNLTYWKAEEYLGLGAGAHSYLNGERYNNLSSIERYIETISGKAAPFENVQHIDKKESMSEFLILGLRLTKGVSGQEFTQRYGEDLFNLYGTHIDNLVKRDLIEVDSGSIRLTKSGLDLANEVFMEFI